MPEDMLVCPYDLEYCQETIKAYNCFSEKIAKAADTNSKLLFFQPGGFSKTLPPCDEVTQANCERYKAYVKSQQNTK